MSPDIILFGAIAAIVVVMFVSRRLGTLSSQEAHRWVAEGATLLDVRTPGEFARGHLQGAINIPVQELPSRIGELRDKSKPVVVYCASGGRSAHAKTLLEAAGFAKVGNLGGMRRW